MSNTVSERIAATRGRVVEVARHNENWNDEYYEIFTAVCWTGTTLERVSLGYGPEARAVAVDVTAEVIEAANDLVEDEQYERLVLEDLRLAAVPAKGKLVVVKRGRTAPIGFEGEIFWTQEQTYSPRYRNGYKTGPDTVKVGIAPVGAKVVNGKREGAVFTYLKNCDVLNPDMYVTDQVDLRNRAALARRFRLPEKKAA